MRPTLVLILAAAALGAPLAAQTTVGQVPIVQDGTILDVTSEGRTTRVPDVAIIRTGVVSQAGGAAAALADNAQRMTRVLAALRAAGVAERDIQTGTIGLSPQYRYVEGQPPKITGYQASNSLTIRFREIGRAGAILDSLVAQGANQIDGPSLVVDKPEGALDEARTDAIKRARARADLYARAAGLSVARIVSIVENGDNGGGAMPPPMMAMARRGEAADTPVVAGERDITATVTVRFALR